MIGIDRNNWLVYEGASLYGHGVWPTPVITRATLIDSPAEWTKLPTSSHVDEAKYVFREDTFDPITGLRRGRLFHWQDGQSQPSCWHVHQHPAVWEDVGHRDPQGRFRKDLLTYYDLQGFGSKLMTSKSEIVIALGSADSLTLWTVVSVERVVSGQDLLTLKARSNFGVLPEIDFERIPVDSKESVSVALTKLRTSAFREQASSVVEQCRPAAQVILSHWFSSITGDHRKTDDLAELMNKIEKHADGKDRKILLNTGRTLALFHNRNKPNVREKLGELARQILESDAAFSLQAVALLIHEVGWSKQAVKR